eukprot:c5154_g1_i1.p1 GENE.c5154_g1_i1~~c5154_g1_i1.p1  ORF type:complete len:202 (-),score=39.34 c5154_g1_i1:327-932(-)
MGARLQKENMDNMEGLVSDEIQAILRGGRNGIMYGLKIRFPHAFVMTFLFGQGSIQSKLKKIFELTYNHARNLCYFVTLYKAMLLVQRKLSGTRKPFHSAIAGAVGGSIVFGSNTPVNQQINLYLLSRIILGAVKLAAERGVIPAPEEGVLRKHGFTMFAGLVWAIVMWLFEKDNKVLQPSLSKSMAFLYWDSERPSHWWP